MLFKLVLFLLFCVFAGVIAFGTFVVLYHFQRFRLKENAHRTRILVFLFGSAIFVWLEIQFVNAISWEQIADILSHNRFIQ